jgi:hypothetical protein
MDDLRNLTGHSRLSIQYLALVRFTGSVVNQRCSVAIIALALVATGDLSAGETQSYGIGDDPRSRASMTTRAMADYGKLPLIFERAVDPADGATRFLSHGSWNGAAITGRGFRFAGRAAAPTDAAAHIAFEFIGANRNARVDGVDPQETRVHRFRNGTGAAPEVDIPTFARVRVSGAYPNVDVVFYGHAGRLEYDIVVEPGGDPSAFGLRVDRGVALTLDDTGDLLVMGDAGTLKLHRPIAYQEIGERRASVESAFVLADAGDVRISVGAYDRTRTLVIDPVVSYATYVGGNSFEQGTAIAVDAGGNAYITGYTLSTDFPTASPYDRSLGKSGDVDVFVSKLNPAGTALVWSTYLGGAGSIDRAVGIAVDAAGSAYITGQTASNNFPVSDTAWQKGITGGGAFVTRLAPAGNTLAYSTYIAGATSNAIAVDRNGYAYVTGSATSAFATTPATLQPAPGNTAGTAFILKLNATGSAPVYSTFLGGSGTDQSTTIAVDAQGNAYVGGWTTSSDFPVVGAIQAVSRGQKDAFVAKLDAAGSRLIYSTLLGGTLDDAVNAIAIDGAGHAYVAGETYSSDFPSKAGFQPLKAGARLINSSVGNAFVAKLTPAGDALVYSSFLGGEVCQTLCQLAFGPQPQYRADAAYGIAVDASGHAYVTGIARSYTFPLVDSSAQRKQEDTEDSAFVTKVGASGATLLWSTFLRAGFNESDNGWTRFPPGAATGVAVDPSGAAYVTGDADSYSTFQPTPGAFQTASTDNQGAVIVKFAATPTMTLTSSNASVDAQTPITLTATIAGPAVAGDIVFMDGAAWIGSAALVGNKATLNTTLPIGIHALNALLRIPGIAADTPIVYQVVDTPLMCN